MLIRNHIQLRDYNLFHIFRMILEEGPVSRTQISERIRLAPSTVSVITAELQGKGFIRECGRHGDHVGRPSILLEVNPQGGYFLAADLTSQNISLGVMDLSLKAVTTETLEDDMRQGEELYQQLIVAFRTLLEKCRERDLPVLGIGVASPGLVSPSGMVIEADNLGWEGMELQSRLQADLDVDVVVVENDTNAAASGEFQYGSVRSENVRNMMMVSIDTGIGSGLILDGKLFSGTNGFAGEFGHVRVDHDGPKCACGRRGCLESVAAVPAMLRAYHERTGDNTLTMPAFLSEISTRNPDALAVADEAAQKIGTMIGSQVNVLNVSTVLLGGRIVQMSQWFLERVRASALEVVLPAGQQGLVIRQASLGNHAGLIGIASLCLMQYFSPL